MYSQKLWPLDGRVFTNDQHLDLVITYYYYPCFCSLWLKISIYGPDLYGSVGWGFVPYTKRCQVWFQVWSHTQVASLILGRGVCQRQLRFLSHFDVSLPLSPPPFSKINKKWVSMLKHNFSHNWIPQYLKVNEQINCFLKEA